MTASYDAIVVGAGPNGLVAANHLADKGWSVLVLEQQREVGGAVHSGEELAPGFIHDTFSAFYPLAAASPSIRSFHLEDHGLTWRHAPAVVGHPTSDGGWALLHRDRYVTASMMDAACPGDGDRWLELCGQWDQIGDQAIKALLSPFPPVKHGVGALTKLPGVGGLTFVRDLLMPAVDLGATRFDGRGPQLLLAGNAGHSDIPLTSPGSGLMGVLMCMLGQTVGFPVPEGGAGMLTQALARRFRSLGGEIRCETAVTRIEVERRRAVGVRTEQGQALSARHAVLANVVASNLYGGLIASHDLPTQTVAAMRSFTLDPGTFKVDWALNGPVPWKSAPAYAPGTFHVADSVDEMNQSLAQVASGAIPAAPFLLGGQMGVADPTRSPGGTETVWAYTHVPQTTKHDAGDDGIRGVWDHDDCERFADRIQARIEELAPGFGSRIHVRRILGPHELQSRNANLVGGAINGGTAQLHQELVFRPIPGWGRAETPIKGLYLASASAHPGGGVHGAAGMNAARAAIAHHRWGAPGRLVYRVRSKSSKRS